MDESTNILESDVLEATEDNTPVPVCDIRFRTGSKTYYFDPNGLEPKTGDHVIIETARGPEFGYCAGPTHTVPASSIVPPLRKVVRIATDKDEYVNADNRRLEKSAYSFCQERIARLGLDMQLVSCEYTFDGSKILFYFTADGRVDFRELVKQLASNFHTRVELRQIGVRDKAKMVGGLGICGRPFCCGQFLNDFAPVSIKMAKTQNLSLNPTKISGTCGRLMCCLKYEQEAYEDLLKTSPKAESFVDTPLGRGTVTDVNLMGQSVKVRLEKDPDQIESFRNDQIAIYRNGKARKTDEPIPDDWAPISGGKPAPEPVEEYPRFERPVLRSEAAQEEAKGRKAKREKKPEAEPVPAPAPQPKKQPAQPKKPAQKSEQPAPEPVEPPAEAQSQQPTKKHRSRGGKNARKPAQNPEQKKAAQPKPEKPAHPKPEKQAKTAQPKPEKQPKPEAQSAKAAEGEPAEAQKKKSKRRYYHKPKKN